MVGAGAADENRRTGLCWQVVQSRCGASERLIIERHDIVSLGNHINHIRLVQHH